VVLHLHNYRLVCAQGLCFTRGEDCTRCHGRDTRPGVRLNCREGSRAEAAVYAAGISLWQRRLIQSADAFVVPSAFALERLRELGAPLGGDARVIPSVQREIAERSQAAAGRYVLAAGRLSPEKGFADAVDAAREADLPLVIAGDGPERAALERRAHGADVRFTGTLAPAGLADVRRDAAAAVVPSRFAEILPLAALEAMAAGLPLAAADAGGLRDLVPGEGRYPPGDVPALAARLRALFGNAAAGNRALAVARERTAPAAVAHRLAELYGATSASVRS
jgi:glycosyltransferase involved in cell wall biosynthesis